MKKFTRKETDKKAARVIEYIRELKAKGYSNMDIGAATFQRFGWAIGIHASKIQVWVKYSGENKNTLLAEIE